jgi:hypothetical protein
MSGVGDSNADETDGKTTKRKRAGAGLGASARSENQGVRGAGRWRTRESRAVGAGLVCFVSIICPLLQHLKLGLYGLRCTQLDVERQEFND